MAPAKALARPRGDGPDVSEVTGRMPFRFLRVIGFFFVGLALAANATASPGQRYDVLNDDTKVFEAPRANAPVVMRLNKGDRVIEWRRQGSWVNISQMGAVGKEGWVKISRLRSEASEIEINMSPQSQFLVQTIVNGKAIEFIVDTGATHVVLDPKDAKKLGFNKSTLKFSRRIRTAGGIVRAAPVVLAEMKIGQLTVRDVVARINKKSMGKSLLGMTFLNRLRGYEVRGKRLVLRW
jgi:clan AA aspartic protease (TIGR02281 family)